MKKHSYVNYTVIGTTSTGDECVLLNTRHKQDTKYFVEDKGCTVFESKSEEWITDKDMNGLLVKAYNDYVHRTFCYQGCADDYDPDRDDAKVDGNLTELGLLYTSNGDDVCYQWSLNIPELYAWCKIDGDEEPCVYLFFKDEQELLDWLNDLNEDDLIQHAETHF